MTSAARGACTVWPKLTRPARTRSSSRGSPSTGIGQDDAQGALVELDVAHGHLVARAGLEVLRHAVRGRPPEVEQHLQLNQGAGAGVGLGLTPGPFEPHLPALESCSRGPALRLGLVDGSANVAITN